MVKLILWLLIGLMLSLDIFALNDVFNEEPSDYSSPGVDAMARGSRIVGGNVADPQRYEYFTLLRIFQKDNRILRCGGSLIHQDIILTVAHCAHEEVDRIVAWVNYTRDDGLTSYEHRVTAAEWFPHPDYNPATGEHDVAILRLSRPVPGVKPVEFNTLPTVPWDSQLATVFGFGRTQAGGPFPVNLMDVSVNIISQDRCNSEDSYDGRVVENSMICAGVDGGGKDACGGDSGAPLIISGRTASLDLQIGIVSWGRGCAEARYPGVYTRISSYADWINDMICQESRSLSLRCIFASVFLFINKRPDPTAQKPPSIPFVWFSEAPASTPAARSIQPPETISPQSVPRTKSEPILGKMKHTNRKAPQPDAGGKANKLVKGIRGTGR